MNLKSIPDSLNIKINTSIPGYQNINFEPRMINKNLNGEDDIVYFNPLKKLDSEIIKKIPKDIQKKQFFNKGLFQSLNNFHGIQETSTLEEATKKKIIDNNISITLKNLFPLNSVIYINHTPYVIVDYQYTRGSWNIDKNIHKFKKIKDRVSNSQLYSNVLKEDIIDSNQSLVSLPDNLLYGSNYNGPKLQIVENKKKEDAIIAEEKKEEEKVAEEKKEEEKIVEGPQPLINDHAGNIQSVIDHQKNRFDDLDQYLQQNPNAQVIIAGISGTKIHTLGTGIAKQNWEPKKYLLMEKNLNTLTEDLKNKYSTRVKYGNVGSKYNPGPNLIHVWGANEDNWNLNPGEKITGGGQAAGMGIQKVGVFGIVTMPTNDPTKLFEEDKTHILKNPIHPSQPLLSLIQPIQNEQRTKQLRTLFANEKYYNLLNLFYKNMDKKTKLTLLQTIQFQNNLQIITDTNSVLLNEDINKQLYNNSVNLMYDIKSTANGNCFFEAVSDAINNYNIFANINPKHNIDTSIKYKNYNKTNQFTIECLRELVYDYIIDNKILDAIIADRIIELNNTFIQNMNEEYTINKNDKDKTMNEYINIIKKTINDFGGANYILGIYYPNEIPENKEEAEEPFRAMTNEELKKYITSNDYWAENIAIDAIYFKLQIYIITILNTKNVFSVPVISQLHKQNVENNKYLFLYNSGEHYELLQFKQKIDDTKFISIFNYNENYKIPFYLLFFTLSSYYFSNTGQNINQIFDLNYINLFFETYNKLCNLQNFIDLFTIFFEMKKCPPPPLPWQPPPPPPQTAGNRNSYNLHPYHPYNPYHQNPYNPYDQHPYEQNYNISQNLGIKEDSNLSYNITIEMELQEGTKIDKKQLHDIKCNQKWNSVRKAYADFMGQKYVIPPIYKSTLKNNNNHNHTKPPLKHYNNHTKKHYRNNNNRNHNKNYNHSKNIK